MKKVCILKRAAALLLTLALVTGAAPALAAGPAAASPELAEFIAGYEGFVAYPYSDGIQWYIGYGTACNPADYPNGITQERALELLVGTLAVCSDAVTNYFARYGVTLSQNQLDALCSMTYGFGTSWLYSGCRLVKAVADGAQKYDDLYIVDSFCVWCHVNGEVNGHLARRRIAEACIFLYGDYSKTLADGFVYLALDAGGGSVENDTVCYVKGAPYGKLPEAALEGKVLDGWRDASGKILAPEDTALATLSVKAVWSAPSVDVDAGPDTGEPEGSDIVLFPDVLPGSWYYDYVMTLAGLNVVNGCPDGTYRPLSSVTLGQALKLILLGSGRIAQEPTGSHWASGYYAYAAEFSMLDESAGTDLDAGITRLDLARLAARALELEASSSASPFADADDPLLTALYEAGIVKGISQDGALVYKPEDAISRAEISAVVYRVMDACGRIVFG